MKKLLVLMFGLIALLLNVGCASIVSETDYPVTINTDDDQDYIVKNELGQKVFTGKGTKTQVLKAGGGWNCMDYSVETPCGTTPINSGVDGWVFGNILLGGVIGLIVDPSTGAACELPAYVNVQDCKD